MVAVEDRIARLEAAVRLLTEERAPPRSEVALTAECRGSSPQFTEGAPTTGDARRSSSAEFRALTAILWALGPVAQGALWVPPLLQPENFKLVWLPVAYLPIPTLATVVHMFALTLEAGPVVPLSGRAMEFAYIIASYAPAVPYAVMRGKWTTIEYLLVVLAPVLLSGATQRLLYRPLGAENFNNIRFSLIRYQRTKLRDWIIGTAFSAFELLLALLFLFFSAASCVVLEGDDMHNVTVFDDNGDGACDAKALASWGLGWFLSLQVFFMLNVIVFGQGHATHERLMTFRLGPIAKMNLGFTAVIVIPAVVFFAVVHANAKPGATFGYVMLSMILALIVFEVLWMGVLIARLPRRALLKEETELAQSHADNAERASDGGDSPPITGWDVTCWADTKVARGPWGSVLLGGREHRPWEVLEFGGGMQVVGDEEAPVAGGGGPEVSAKQVHTECVRRFGGKPGGVHPAFGLLWVLNHAESSDGRAGGPAWVGAALTAGKARLREKPRDDFVREFTRRHRHLLVSP